jgi:hypothetical protein
VNRTPCIVYTFNSAFRGDKKKSKRARARNAKEQYLDEMLDEFEINEERIVYWGKDINEDRKFVAESAEIVAAFIERYADEFTPDVTIFSDAGNAFKVGGSSVFDQVGSDHVYIWPSAVHHYFSVNDNNYHGYAKAQWRKGDLDFADDVRSTLYLMEAMDAVPRDLLVRWWSRNLALGVADADLHTKMTELCPGSHTTNLGNTTYLEECRSYYVANVKSKVDRNGKQRALTAASLESPMNGPYWQ